MAIEITERELETLLLRLGFQLVANQPGSHKALEHKATGTTVVLNWVDLNNYRPDVVIAARRLLDEKGILDRGDFDVLAKEIKTSATQRV